MKKIVEDIVKIIESEQRVNAHHLLKTREAGSQTFVEVHLVFDCIITLMEAHRVTDRIEDQIKMINIDRDWVINIHMDPYDDFEINDQGNKACSIN